MNLSDAFERRTGIDPSRSFIVQAPAGSGKTELLIQRVLSLLATVERPEEILAITFTRKAAGEMRQRLMDALHQAQGPRPEASHAALTWELARKALEQDAQCGWRLLDNPSLFSIQTIDSFNASLVRRMPWLARLGGLPEIAEDAAPLYRMAADRVVERLDEDGESGASLALLLSHLDNRLDLLRDLLAEILPRRDQWLRHIVPGNPRKERARLEEALQNLVRLHLTRALDAVPQGLRESLVALARFAADNLADSPSRPLSVFRNVSRFPNDSADDLPVWLGLADLLLTSGGSFRKKLDKNCGFPPQEKDRKEEMLELIGQLSQVSESESLLVRLRTLPPLVYSDEQWEVLEALTRILLLASAELWVVFRQQNQADFPEIALKALQSLREDEQPSELLLKLDRRISHILVDEFQDTSYLQYALLENLISGWEAGDGRTLFLVGDPMQSIYRFREAEVGLFLKARSSGIDTFPLEPLYLRSNFRSQGELVRWFNDSFSRLFPPREDQARGAVPYSAADAVLGSLSGAAVRVHPMAQYDTDREAGLVCELIRTSREENPGGSVAVLVRSRSHLVRILTCLKEAGIAYQAKDVDLLEKRPVARDIVSLTKALLHPADRLSWFAVLRAPWCGLVLEDLFTLGAGRTLAESIQDPAILDLLTLDGRERVRKVAPIFYRGLRLKGRTSVRALVEGCWLSLGGAVCTDAAGLADAETVFELLERLDRGGDIPNIEGLEEELSKLFAACETPQGEFVHVMTMHKAKGLEFDTVILPGLGRPPRSGDRPLLRWTEHPGCGLLMAPVHSRIPGDRDPVFDAIGGLEKDKEELEAARLLYVAVTRARKRLHLVGHARRNSQSEPRPASGSLLQTLWPRVEEFFQTEESLELTDSPLTALQKDEGGILRLPSDWECPKLQAVSHPHFLKAQAASQTGSFEEERDLFSGWEDETARYVGTVAHAYLDAIAKEGLSVWPVSRAESLGPEIQKRLNALGVPLRKAKENVPKVVRALTTSIMSEKGQWFLGATREAYTELPLSGVIHGKMVHAVIDRSFVDESGTRWIVDYKIIEPAKGNADSFLSEKGQRYRGQMEAYAALFSRLEPRRTIRTALYFPLMDAWLEMP